VREEKDIFSDLANLCVSAGFAHVIASYCLRDHTVGYADEITPADYIHMFSMEGLIRTEISTLIGLMLRKDIDYSLPTPEVIDDLMKKTDSLLKELHESMLAPIIAEFNSSKIEQVDFNPFSRGAALREPIFYGGESAYYFQYRDFSLKKYIKDNNWLLTNKGFSIQDAKTVISSISEIQNRKILGHLKGLNGKEPQHWTILPGYVFSTEEVVSQSSVEKSTVAKILQAFAPLEGMRNEKFNALNDFNITNAYPLIDIGNQEYLLFQYYSLVEALYETPFYWMSSDKAYVNEAMSNRGEFTEEFSFERLELVFGKHRVFKNINIIDSKKKKAGEIDVLVIFANRAIVLQAKSKRLTLESRKGNDNSIKDDFKKGIQNSYDQGLSCSKLLSDLNYKLVDSWDNEINIPRQYKEIYIFCIVSDHYPALSFQARQFLKYEQTENILPPFVMDVFLLDAMTEFLQSPLRFLSYVNRRTLYSEKIHAFHELTVLSYHLKQNLWVEDKYDLVQLCDDISADLDLAMMVRREEIPGDPTPDGILTRFKDTTIDNIIQKIEERENATTIDFGFMLLTLDEETVVEVSEGINHIARMAQKDKKHHDLTIGIGTASTGLTIHCNNDPLNFAKNRLKRHCEQRKYKQKADNWFGICVEPNDISIRFGLEMDYQWIKSGEMEKITKELPNEQRKIDLRTKGRSSRKIGRNEPCPCGSGKKYKKCCLNV
jgi:SEC-C motif/Nuclease-related domain